MRPLITRQVVDRVRSVVISGHILGDSESESIGTVCTAWLRKVNATYTLPAIEFMTRPSHSHSSTFIGLHTPACPHEYTRTLLHLRLSTYSLPQQCTPSLAQPQTSRSCQSSLEHALCFKQASTASLADQICVRCCCA